MFGLQYDLVRKGVLVPGVVAVLGTFCSAASAGCFTNLSHLDTKLPHYADPQLESLRNQIITTDLQQALETAKAQGYTPSSAAAAALQQADAYDATRTQAEECIRKSAVNPEETIAALQAGTYDFSSDGIADACAGAYAAWYLGAVANRESAIGLACLAQ